MTNIRIPVDDELAERYNAAPPAEREKIQVLLGWWLREITTSPAPSLMDLMDTISERAQSRGLTPEILASLLDEDE